MKPQKSMSFTNHKENQMEETFEDMFKSEAVCGECGQHMDEEVQKSAAKRKKKGMAKQIGNEMDPHKGGKTGTFVNHQRPGSLGSKVDRNHSSKPRKPANGMVGKSEGEEIEQPEQKPTVVKALFPVRHNVQLVDYALVGQTGMVEDTSKTPNLAMMNEAGEQE